MNAVLDAAEGLGGAEGRGGIGGAMSRLSISGKGLPGLAPSVGDMACFPFSVATAVYEHGSFSKCMKDLLLYR